MKEELLEKYLASEKKERLAILTSLGREKSPETGTLLSKLYQEEKDKELLKTIRKLIFHLSTRGVKVERLKEKGSPALRRISKERFAKGYISSYDEESDRIALVVTETRKDIFLLGQAIINLKEGLREIRTGEANRIDCLSWLEKRKALFSDKDIFFAEVSASYAFYLIEEACRRSGKLKEEVEVLRRFLTAHASGEKVKNPSDVQKLYVDTNAEIAPERLVNHRIFRNLFLRWDNMESDRNEYEKIGESTIVLPGYLKEEKRKEYLRELLKKGRFGSVIADMKRILEDYGYILSSEGDHLHAKAILAALKNQDHFEAILIHLLEKSISQSSTREYESHRLIISPHEYLRNIYGKVPS